MKIIGIVGSSRKNGNTDILVKKVLEGAKQSGAEVEVLYLSDYNIIDCLGCEGCAKTNKCVIKDDMHIIYEKLDESDGLVLGSPTYFYNVSGRVKVFMDRLYQYEVFDDNDRSVWSSVNELNGIKYAVTVAICEQESIEDMGVTSLVMEKTLNAVGWRSVANLKAIHLFKKGEADNYSKTLEEAENSGIKLVKTIKLKEKIQKGN